MALRFRTPGGPEPRDKYKQPPKQGNPLTKATKVAGSVKKSLDTLDKYHETNLEKSGLLTDEKFTTDIVVDEILDPNAAPGPWAPSQEVTKNIDMFTRKPIDAPDNLIQAMNPIDYFERTTTSAFDRVMLNPEYVADPGFNATGFHTNMIDQGFESKDVMKILGGTEGIEVLPGGGSAAEWEYSEIGNNQIIDPNLTPEDYMLQKSGKSKFGNMFKGAKQKVGKAFEDSGFDFDLSDDIAELGKNIYGQGGKFVSDITSLVPKNVSGSLDVLGDIAKAGGKEAAKLAGNIASTAGNVMSAVGPVIGTVQGGKRSFEGLKMIAEGDVGQGIEDTVQGAIQIASPVLIAAGPVGWAVLGASMLEDWLFD